MFAFLRKLWPFPWPSRKQEELPEPTNPILLIPGICGTQLAVRDKNSDKPPSHRADRVWVCIAHADREYKKLWGRVNPTTKQLDLLDKAQEVVIPRKDPAKEPKDDDGGLYPIDVLDPSLYVPLHVVYYYHNLIWYLKKHKYEPAKTLFGYGYDFRQSNTYHLDDLVHRLEVASAACDGAKVDVVTHSMGGLVMRSLLALRPKDYSRLVRKWIAIACPFGGAPGFGMDALMTGVEFCQGWEQYFFVNRSTMHVMCSQAPAVYELLPDPINHHVWPPERGPPKCTVYHQTRTKRSKDDANRGGVVEVEGEDDVLEVKLPEGGTLVAEGNNGDDGGVQEVDYSIADFRNVLGATLKGYKVETLEKEEVEMDMDPHCWDISDKARVAWRSCKVPQGTQFFNIFGTGFETAYDVEYGSVEEPVASPTDITSGTPVRRFSWIDGDSTVPLCCAVADGLDAVERKGFFATHRGLLEQPKVWEAVLDFVDVPMEETTASSSADTFPTSHVITAAAQGGAAGAVKAEAAGGKPGVQPGRARRNAQLRAEASARSKAHRNAWTASAKVTQASGKGAVRHSVEGGWVMVNKRDVLHVARSGVSGAHAAPDGRLSTSSSVEEIVNPIQEHLSRQRAQGGPSGSSGA